MADFQSPVGRYPDFVPAMTVPTDRGSFLPPHTARPWTLCLRKICKTLMTMRTLQVFVDRLLISLLVSMTIDTDSGVPRPGCPRQKNDEQYSKQCIRS